VNSGGLPNRESRGGAESKKKQQSEGKPHQLRNRHQIEKQVPGRGRRNLKNPSSQFSCLNAWEKKKGSRTFRAAQIRGGDPTQIKEAGPNQPPGKKSKATEGKNRSQRNGKTKTLTGGPTRRTTKNWAETGVQGGEKGGRAWTSTS